MMGACSAGSGHVQFLDTTAVESLYGEKHESEPQQGLKIGVGCANQHKRPVWHSPSSNAPRTVNPGPSQLALLLDTSNILSSELCFNLPLGGKLVSFRAEVGRPVSIGEGLGWPAWRGQLR